MARRQERSGAQEGWGHSQADVAAGGGRGRGQGWVAGHVLRALYTHLLQLTCLRRPFRVLGLDILTH